ncbi:hypothetical protein [Chitinasiproducens palmae]|uniref:hypothetical protein n=1 Tax=Chitinasiproducens palmae TaxID=1770053 RepID=UPI00111387D9|nr:hypothetical protein [Chitinasiproducens palmae]
MRVTVASRQESPYWELAAIPYRLAPSFTSVADTAASQMQQGSRIDVFRNPATGSCNVASDAASIDFIQSDNERVIFDVPSTSSDMAALIEVLVRCGAFVGVDAIT